MHDFLAVMLSLESAFARRLRVRIRSAGFAAYITLVPATGALLPFAAATPAQNESLEWLKLVREYAGARNWTAALEVVERQIALSPGDTDVCAWRARILTWSGRLEEAEAEYLRILTISRKDPDIWLGLANVYLRKGKNREAVQLLNTAVELDPTRADLYVARGLALRRLGKDWASRQDFQKALALDPSSEQARLEMRVFENERKHELRLGQENDLLSFAAANHAEWVSLSSRWNSRWGTVLSGNTYQRGGIDAGKFVGTLTAHTLSWGALTVGGARGHDNGIVPRGEAFFDLDRGWKSRAFAIRGLELEYGQHWYWYQAAHILGLTGAATIYFPREWTVTLSITNARSAFSGTGAEWRPSGVSRIGFPLAHWADKRLNGNLMFAAGTEDFARVDQVGRFASQTYGGGLRLQLTANQDVSGYGSYQKRTQGRTDANFGFSYGIHF